MSYISDWYIQDRVMHVAIHGELTTQMVIQINQDLNAMLDKGTAPVHYIAEVMETESVSVSAFKMPSALDFLRHKNMGWSIVVGGNQVLNVMTNIVGKLAGINFKTASTIDEAMHILYNVDATLREDT